MNSLGSTIKQARIDKGMKLRELAKELGISPGYLSNIENDRTDTPPSGELLKKIASILTLNETNLLALADILPNKIKKAVKDILLDGKDENELENLLISFRKKK
jgi:transcriptional regulator with XRE-family HTH domain